jgi:galactokinase
MTDNRLIELYGINDLARQQQRYRNLIREFNEYFETPQSFHFVSAPVGPRSDNLAILKSSAFPRLFKIDLSELDPRSDEKGTSEALIRGVAAGFKKRGCVAGGFNAVLHSDVFSGSGLSSSASFEVLVGGILNTLYNKNRIDPVTLAKIGQYAENVYFDKPCGLMDQLACAAGGVLAIDFEDNENPVVEKIPTDFTQSNYILAVVDTDASHADLTRAYASIPIDMKQVASLFGKNTLREVGEESFHENIGMVRSKAGDRAVLRALHFFAENHRVVMMADALKAGNFEIYLRLVAESGASSCSMLQNTIPPGDFGKDQPAALAIGVSNDFFRSRGHGVARIHGGGFAGTIQAYIHKDQFEDYSRLMKKMFGDDCVLSLIIRMRGLSAIEEKQL